MTTWYVDYEGGTDSNASAGNGDSFATRRKKIDNCVAAAIAPGDTIRVMGSPAPTSVGNGTWTNGPLQGNSNAPTYSNTTPITGTITNASADAMALQNGDTLIVYNAVGNTAANGVWKVSNLVRGGSNTTYDLLNADGSNSSGNGTWSSGSTRKFTNAIVTLATACTQNIALCGNRGTKTNWTASANVTCTVSTNDYKEGGECQSVAIAAGFTTGLAAYYATGTLDLSGYQQVSFWVKQTAGTLGAAGAVRLRLCTDTAGATPVHDIPIPALGALNQFVPVVVDLATNLNSAIQSINFDVVTDNGAQTFLIDNVIACKAASSADSLNLTSLISKDPGDHSYGDGYECWFGIQSINGTRIVLDGTVNSIPGSSPQRGYSGTTETVTTYKRETIKTVMVGNGITVQILQDAGTAGNLITFSGGWDRTAMATQDGETWFSGQNGQGYGIRASGGSEYTVVDRLGFSRYEFGTYHASTDQSIGRVEYCNTSGSPVFTSGTLRLTATTLSAVCCGGPIAPGTAAVVTTIGRADSTTSGYGVAVGASARIETITQANNNTSSGINGGSFAYIGTATANGNASLGYQPASNSVIGYGTFNYNTNGPISFNSNSGHNARILGGSCTGNGGPLTPGGTGIIGYLRNFTINEATEVSGFIAYGDSRVYSENHDGTANNVQIFCDGGLISKQSSVVHGSASHAWKFSPTSTNRSQYYPLNLPIAQIAVAASALVTVKAWMRRSNTGLTGKLVCKGGQLAGVASDVSSSITAIADTWEQITVSCTPSESGVLEIEAQFYGGTTYNGYVSDLEITQA